jgi:hypothetical protein
VMLLIKTWLAVNPNKSRMRHTEASKYFVIVGGAVCLTILPCRLPGLRISIIDAMTTIESI